jgi:ubiquinone/menaquinone biosynthesis C-methylase UbiE
MTTSFAHEPGAGLADDALPSYSNMLHAYHSSREAELRKIVGMLPLKPGDHTLDVASGDGCYAIWLAERGAHVVGIDLSPAFIDHARRAATATAVGDRIQFEQSDAAALPFADASFDLAWCAQSFYSLPDPLATLREMIRVTKPGGHIALLENDTLHHMLLPWPAELELAVRQAQMCALEASYAGQGLDKFYIGRNLCGVFRQCGIDTCDMRTYTVERHAPLGADEELFLRLYFADLRERAWPHLSAPARVAFDTLFDSHSTAYLLRQPDFHLTHIESLAIGRKL